jgi:DpnII restriction endonuclease
VRRYIQTELEILGKLSQLDTSWEDEHALKIIGYLKALPPDATEIRRDIDRLLEIEFECAVDIVRLFLGLSADEFRTKRSEQLGEGGIGITRFRKAKADFMGALERLGLESAITAMATRPMHWSDVLVERLKAGRGSAIKGQRRGREFETATEAVVKEVFGIGRYDVRCRFVGKTGTSTEKADFAIPSKIEPRILIEVKAYGATGSKQTDILGDFHRIIEEKRADTDLLLVVDGITWKARVNDLRKLIQMQNRGEITRIYTTQMFEDLRKDLKTLGDEHHLFEPHQ